MAGKRGGGGRGGAAKQGGGKAGSGKQGGGKQRAGWPAKTSNRFSGDGRDNNPPKATSR